MTGVQSAARLSLSFVVQFSSLLGMAPLYGRYRWRQSHQT